jgi:hypothetical protein
MTTTMFEQVVVADECDDWGYVVRCPTASAWAYSPLRLRAGLYGFLWNRRYLFQTTSDGHLSESSSTGDHDVVSPALPNILRFRGQKVRQTPTGVASLFASVSHLRYAHEPSLLSQHCCPTTHSPYTLINTLTCPMTMRLVSFPTQSLTRIRLAACMHRYRPNFSSLPWIKDRALALAT